MKLKFLLLAVMGAMMFSSTLTAQGFEGVITMESSSSEGIAGTFSVKGDKVLIEVNKDEKPAKMLSDRTTGEITVLIENEEKKFALKMGPDMFNGMGDMAGMQDAKEKADEVKFNFTGKTKMIGKYKCEQVLTEDKENEVEAWMTKDLGITLFDIFPMMKEATKTDTKGAAMFELLQKGMVMEANIKNKVSGETEKVTTKVDKKKLPADMFVYSEEEYKVYDMTNMMQMMMEAQNDPEKMQELQEIFQQMNGGGF